MITIDWITVTITASVTVIVIVILAVIRGLFKRKTKYDLSSLKLLVYEAGMKNREVYENIKKLEEAFKELEGK